MNEILIILISDIIINNMFNIMILVISIIFIIILIIINISNYY